MPSEPESADIFNCQQCGECCKGYGGTYISENDIAAISEYIGMSADDFVTNCCQHSGKRLVLAQGKNGYCMFWKDKLCTIHPVKPRMCRKWPFLESVLTDIINWKTMADSCPGIRTDVSEEMIIERVKKELLALNT